MATLQVSDLYTLEEYHKVRSEFRAKVLAHKKQRQVPVGPNATLYFEDRLTMQYQIQEMLRTERITRPSAIEHRPGGAVAKRTRTRLATGAARSRDR